MNHSLHRSQSHERLIHEECIRSGRIRRGFTWFWRQGLLLSEREQARNLSLLGSFPAESSTSASPTLCLGLCPTGCHDFQSYPFSFSYYVISPFVSRLSHYSPNCWAPSHCGLRWAEMWEYFKGPESLMGLVHSAP